jgi:hypothetical protein
MRFYQMKKMDKLKVVFLAIILLLSGVSSLDAQKVRAPNLPKYDLKKYHFGFLLAYNKFDFNIKPYSNLNAFDSLMVVESQPQSGFNLGVISNLRLNNNFDLRFTPTLSFGARIINYTVMYRDTVAQVIKKNVESTYIDFPLLLKFKSSRMNNARVYVIGGLNYSIDLASQAKKKNEQQNEVMIKLLRNDYSFQLGVGADFYLTYFKFSTEFKMAYGFRDLIQREGNLFSNSIERLNSKIMQVSFLFE